jgi:hypothetical protein
LQIPDFRKMASCRAERGEKGVRLGRRTLGCDRRFQITDFREVADFIDARTGGDKGLADTHPAATCDDAFFSRCGTGEGLSALDR